MNRIMLLMLTIYCLDTTGQEVRTLYSGSHKLNGGARSQFGGISRMVVPVVIPNKAIQLIYTISTSSGEGVNPVRLTTQIASMLAAGYSTAITSATNITDLIAPSRQTGLLSVHLFIDYRCAQLFEQKAYQECNPNYYQPNITGCSMAFPCDGSDESHTLYIGIKNPQSMESTYFQIEVSAIIKNETPPPATTEDNYAPANNSIPPSYYFKPIELKPIYKPLIR